MIRLIVLAMSHLCFTCMRPRPFCVCPLSTLRLPEGGVR